MPRSMQPRPRSHPRSATRPGRSCSGSSISNASFLASPTPHSPATRTLPTLPLHVRSRYTICGCWTCPHSMQRKPPSALQSCADSSAVPTACESLRNPCCHPTLQLSTCYSTFPHCSLTIGLHAYCPLHSCQRSHRTLLLFVQSACMHSSLWLPPECNSHTMQPASLHATVQACCLFLTVSSYMSALPNSQVLSCSHVHVTFARLPSTPDLAPYFLSNFLPYSASSRLHHSVLFIWTVLLFTTVPCGPITPPTVAASSLCAQHLILSH
jgi:hypothetical protein